MSNNCLNSSSHPSEPKASLNNNVCNAFSTQASLADNTSSSTKTHSEIQYAFTSLPLIIQQALTQQKRIICIANNPSITIDKLKNLLEPTDILVLFNNFIHGDYFVNDPIASQLPKLIFFRQIGDSLIHFGMPPRSNNVDIINKMAKQAPLGFLFGNQTYQFPTPEDDQNLKDDTITANRILTIPSALAALLHDDDYCRILSEQHPVVADYPHFENIHSSAPSSGFLLYRLLLAARLHVQQLQDSTALLKIVMLGFNDDDKTGYFWSGHNWQFEREEMGAAPTGVQVIRQY